MGKAQLIILGCQRQGSGGGVLFKSEEGEQAERERPSGVWGGTRGLGG